METEPTSALLEVPIQIESAFEVDDVGVLHLVSFVFTDSEDTGAEIRTRVEDIVDELIDFYETEGHSHQLYAMANEFARFADRLRATADHLEGGWPPYDDLPLDDERLD